MLPCSHAPMLPCSHAPMLPCSHAPMLSAFRLIFAVLVLALAWAVPGFAQISFDASSTTGGAIRPGFATVCDAAALGALRTNAGVLERCDGSAWSAVGGGGGGSVTVAGDRIVSTSANIVVGNGGTISLTTGGVSGTAYFDTVGRLVVPGISTTGVVSTNQIFVRSHLQLQSTTTPTACTANSAGTLRYNSPTAVVELCNGAAWLPMGVGIPAGTISAFASTTCPTGWSEYVPSRGRFLRGIDNGAGNDPSGTRLPGDIQDDNNRSHTHTGSAANAGSHAHNTDKGPSGGWGGDSVNTRFQVSWGVSVGSISTSTVGDHNHTVSISSTGIAEARPKNVAVTFCQFQGTSNGWNNPLGGGGAAAAWVNFNGGDGSIRKAFNVSSVTRTSAGRYTINFATPLADNNYVVIAGPTRSPSADAYNEYKISLASGYAPTSSSFSVVNQHVSTANGFTDSSYVYLVVFN